MRRIEDCSSAMCKPLASAPQHGASPQNPVLSCACIRPQFCVAVLGILHRLPARGSIDFFHIAGFQISRAASDRKKETLFLLVIKEKWYLSGRLSPHGQRIIRHSLCDLFLSPMPAIFYPWHSSALRDFLACLSPLPEWKKQHKTLLGRVGLISELWNKGGGGKSLLQSNSWLNQNGRRERESPQGLMENTSS